MSAGAGVPFYERLQQKEAQKQQRLEKARREQAAERERAERAELTFKPRVGRVDVSGDFYERQARFEARKAEKMSRLKSQEAEREKFTFRPEISETSRYLVEARRGQQAGLREREIVDDIVVQGRLGKTRGKPADLSGSKLGSAKNESSSGRRPFQPEIGEFAERIRFDKPVVDRLYSTRGSYVKRSSDVSGA